jgi:hypothetical protein
VLIGVQATDVSRTHKLETADKRNVIPDTSVCKPEYKLETAVRRGQGRYVELHLEELHGVVE